jgi:ABC-2 type transport system permease protein
MNKFLAVVKREYVQRVRTKLFVVMTVLGPILLMVFTVVPGMLMTIKGDATRIAVVDQTDGSKLYQPIRDSLLKRGRGRGSDQDSQPGIGETVNSNTRERLEKTGKSMASNYVVEPVDLAGRSLDEVRPALNRRVANEELDGYLILPPDILTNSESKPVYYARNMGDVFTREQIQQEINSAVRRQRLLAAGVNAQAIEQLSKQLSLEAYPVNEKGEAGSKASGAAGFVLPFVIAFLIYITVLLYGQVILGAVVEEKETRIAEILFSSVRSSTLMLGKLVGVSLVALTQLGIWVLAFAALSVFGLSYLEARGLEGVDIHLPLSFFVYFFMFFGLGYFIYATLYVLVGSMVTTTQEGGQVAMPIIFTLMAGLYLMFPVMRSPNSSFATWVSMVPFFSPIVMVVRIVTQKPPLWQIVLSFSIGVITVFVLLMLAARIYRVGMLMYGKKATIPEVWRWVKQA